MGKQYDLANGICRFQVKDGILYSAGAVRDGRRTEYINEKQGFGKLVLTYVTDGKRTGWKPLSSGTLKEEGVKRKGRDLYYRCRTENECLSVSVDYCLRGNTLHQELTVENRTEFPIELEDFGITFACHTDFGWGKDASGEVIGHYFIAEHGSHATYYRCDGNGPVLTVLPAGDSRWIYYDCPEHAHRQVQEKDTVTVYPLNGYVGRRAEEKGAGLRIPCSGYTLMGKERWKTACDFFFARDYADCGRQLVERGQVQAESIPGYTVPRDLSVSLCLACMQEPEVTADCGDVCIRAQRREEGRYFYTLDFSGLGERDICISCNGRRTHLYYFITEPIRTLLEKRASFLTSHQVREEDKWYRGLFTEWNNETGVELTPDNYDRIRGWRIYEVTCDDPGLSKPAFLSSKQTVAPVQEQVDALEDYIRYFVWGGLQQTEEEPYPYGIYGIPDWHTLRNSPDPGNKGRTHLWRIYDYPHIALLYYNMYETARLYPHITTRLPGKTYLLRAYRTALAMFQVPEELDGWSAYKTGLYNELVIPRIAEALDREGCTFEAGRLAGHWERKAAWFAQECRDIFGSEYPFDTTGFESTHILAKEALRLASFERSGDPFRKEISYEKAAAFMENQIACNVACRGLLEPAYFWYGSDYRGNNMHYTLSYMSQMGGWALLDYACYHAQDPFGILRLAYGSLLSSWALLNSGDEESNYGWWFPGKENDGCACGGFEPLYGHKTWLEQPCTGGAWYYSCEIDLGFCGGIRGAAAVLAEDPLFGMTAYGAALTQQEDGYLLDCRDGVGRRFHFLGKDGKVHVELEGLRLADTGSILFAGNGERITLRFCEENAGGNITIRTEAMGDYRTEESGETIRENEPWTGRPGNGQLTLIRLGETGKKE